MIVRRVPQFLPGYRSSYAMLSRASGVDTAIIFVHGFGGNPTSTWMDFHTLVDEYSVQGAYSWWQKTDMFFYNYESLDTPVRRNAALLKDFVSDLLSNKWRDHPSMPVTLSTYQDLILAGHSEGGVVIRRMVLDTYEAIKHEVEAGHAGADPKEVIAELSRRLDSDLIMRACLRLFAPACMGTNFSSWAGFLTSWSHLVAAIVSSSLVKNELVSSSPILRMLQVGTEQAHAMFRNVRSLHTQPLFGTADQIVYADSYQGETLLWDDGCDHFAVCKPNFQHARPMEFVQK